MNDITHYDDGDEAAPDLVSVFIGRLIQAGTLLKAEKWDATEWVWERRDCLTRIIDQRYIDQPHLLSQTPSHRCLLNKPTDEFRISSSEYLL